MPSEPATGQQLYHGATLAPARAAQVVGSAILGIYAVQIGLYSAGLLEVAAAALGFGAVLAALVLYLRVRAIPRGAAGVTRPRGAMVAAALLIGLSAWYVNLVIVALVNPTGDAKSLEKLIEQTPLAPTLLAVALLPAVVEELVFRGIFARALASRMPTIAACALSAAVFAIYHLQPAQMIATFVLGWILAFLTLRSASVIPAMIAHLVNNTMAIVVSRDSVPGMSSWMAAHPTIMLAASAGVLGAGIALTAWKGHA